MACTVLKSVQTEVSLETNGQTREKVFAIVDALLRQYGTVECGIMAHFSFALGERPDLKPGSDPGAELKKLGVIGLKTTETD